jgi:3-isopropylmalate/(R)-2-methylmalate dehydratase large subunit
MPGRTVIDRIWDDHLVAELGAGRALLHIDRIFLHERTGPAVLEGLAKAGRRPAHPEQVFGIADHIVPTAPGRSEATLSASAASFIGALRRSTQAAGIRMIDLHDPRQGIVHVVAPELGLALPGMTLVCPDSHTGTVGGLGALAWGIGSTEGEHAVATQTLVRAAAPQMRVYFDGPLAAGCSAKDMVLALLHRHGATGGVLGGVGCAIEFAGSAVRALPVEARLTLCNMAVEFGAWTGLVAPDSQTVEWVAGRPFAPQGAAFDAAALHWQTLVSDDHAAWDAELRIDVSRLTPQVTWGTSPEHGGAVDAAVPDPDACADPGRRAAAIRALHYMGLQPGVPLAGTPINAAFIGSCTNARLSDLREAAQVLRGRQVAPGVRALVVPGSMAVRAAAEAEGLHHVFEAAGFEWRLSGCSLCFFSGGDSFGASADGQPLRVISSTNRNFEGRQGPGVRTHLASPATVAASALAGTIADPRPLLQAHRPAPAGH